MLTADLVNARRRGNELRLVALDAAGRERAVALAAALVEVARSHVDLPREDLVAALSSIDVDGREHRMKEGLAKLIEDRCEFDAEDALDPSELRRDVFTRASAARHGLEMTERFDRAAVLAAVAAERGVASESIEQALFADLRGAHRLRSFDAPSPETLVAEYEHGQAQAVLLRAVKVIVDVRCASAGALRDLFRQLKFLRLLHVVSKSEVGHRIVIDGPFSLFDSVTKYGLQLALVLPALESCDAWKLEADVRWGKNREALVFRLAGGVADTRKATAGPPLPDEVATLVESFEALGTAWRVTPNADILELPGVGLCIPDLVFERKVRGAEGVRVYLEVMGYWSRAAVWRRVELVQAGLAERVLFAVNAKLRVSEDVLGDEVPGALYVYKRTMSARAVAERLDALAPTGHLSKYTQALLGARSPKAKRAVK